MRDVFPPENQRGYSWAPWVMVWNVLTTPSCSNRARFQQKCVILSGPGALQFLFFLITFTVFSLSKMKVSSEMGACTRWLIAVFTSSNQLAHLFPVPFFSHSSSRSYFLLQYFQTYHVLLPGWESCTLVARYGESFLKFPKFPFLSYYYYYRFSPNNSWGLKSPPSQKSRKVSSSVQCGFRTCYKVRQR